MYDLTYFRASVDGIQDELDRDRSKCGEFMAYRPGYSPADHMELEKLRRLSVRNFKMNLAVGITGVAIGALLTWMLQKLF